MVVTLLMMCSRPFATLHVHAEGHCDHCKSHGLGRTLKSKDMSVFVLLFIALIGTTDYLFVLSVSLLIFTVYQRTVVC